MLVCLFVKGRREIENRSCAQFGVDENDTLGKRTWPLKTGWWSTCTVSVSPFPRKAGTRERMCCVWYRCG